MAKKARPQSDDALDALKNNISSQSPRKLYVFHGEERYLVEHYLGELRKLICPGGLNDFNYRRYEGKDLSADELAAACETLPVFSERTLVEVHDFDLFKTDSAGRETLTKLLGDLPEYVCLIFIYDVLDYAPDKRQKLASVLNKEALAVEFAVQPQQKLINWISRHFKKSGKKIDAPTADYLAFVTGGLMTTLKTEIEKLSSYVKGDTVTREHIDALVSPVVEAVSWKLADNIVSGRFDEASSVLSDLIDMREPPHLLIYSITLTLRRLMAARLCLDNSMGSRDLMRMTGLRHEFQARNLLSSARKTTTERCAQFVRLSADTAYRMNTGGDHEYLLTELLLRLAACYKGLASC